MVEAASCAPLQSLCYVVAIDLLTLVVRLSFGVSE
jgi:hypothetical protein